MRRVIAFFEWEIKEWEKRSQCVRDGGFPAVTNDGDPEVIVQRKVNEARTVDDGRLAYAARQISVRRQLIKTYTANWVGLQDLLTNVGDEEFSAKELVEFEPEDVPETKSKGTRGKGKKGKK